MIESFLDVFRRLTNNGNSPPDLEDSSHQKKSEDSFLAAVPIVQKIVRRRLVSFRQADASDLEQGIVLRLLKWREKYHEKGEQMSPQEWNCFAARAANNEVNRYFSSGIFAEIPLETVSEIAGDKSVEGETKIETESLARFVWQDICKMSLRQRRALLLQSQQLIVYFLQGGINDEELAKVLEFAESEWLEVKIKLPLSDVQIARFADSAETPRSLESIAKSIKKARHEARARLRKLTNK